MMNNLLKCNIEEFEKVLENVLKNRKDIDSPEYEATYYVCEVLYKEAILVQELNSLADIETVC